MRIFAQAPSRISLFGGGTDLPIYYEKYGATVINMAINIRTNILLYTGDDIFLNPMMEIPPGASTKLAYQIMTDHGIGSMHHATIKSTFDGIIGAGLGSSASFSVALLKAIYKSKGEKKNSSDLVHEAYGMEQKIGWYGGIQDQLAAAIGGINIFRLDKKSFETYTLNIASESKIEDYLLLFYIGGKRHSYKFQRSFIHPTAEQTKYLHEIAEIAKFAAEAFMKGNVELIAKLLDASWEAKKKSNKVSTEAIDIIYKYAKDIGATGGKLLGAGGGGYMIFLVDPSKQKNFIKEMAKIHLEPTDYSIDYQGAEARIL